MHLVIPFAYALSEGARSALRGLELPHLQRLLERLDSVEADETDELSLSAPHERALARAHGWTVQDGLLPLAAQTAQALGLPAPAGTGWAFVHPSHWHVGTEQISLTDPAALALDASQAGELFAAVAPLFTDGGWQLHPTPDPLCWLASHDVLARLPTASLDRVIGRNVDRWLEAAATARTELRQVRRLQAEAQMLLHSHPLNQAREARHLAPVNSLWFSGTGPAPQVPAASATPLPVVDDRLRSPALGERWDEWRTAWLALDAGPLRELLAQPDGTIRLTLCGERQARQHSATQRPWWRRGPLAPRAPRVSDVLEQL